MEKYHVTAQGPGFTPTTRGMPGSFSGIWTDKDEKVDIVNENRAYDGWELGARGGSPGNWIGGATFDSKMYVVHSDGTVETRDSGYSPYRNFTAKDLKGASWVAVQIWELGNSLAYITGKDTGSLLVHQSKTEPGYLFTNCVREKYGKPFGMGNLAPIYRK